MKDVRGHLHPCDEETLKQNHVRSFEGGGDVTLGLLQLLLVEVCSVTKTEARCISQARKQRATITGAKTQEAPQDQTQPLDSMRQNAYRAGSVRPQRRKRSQKNNTCIIRFQNFLFYRKLWKLEVARSARAPQQQRQHMGKTN